MALSIRPAAVGWSLSLTVALVGIATNPLNHRLALGLLGAAMVLAVLVPLMLVGAAAAHRRRRRRATARLDRILWRVDVPSRPVQEVLPLAAWSPSSHVHPVRDPGARGAATAEIARSA